MTASLLLPTLDRPAPAAPDPLEAELSHILGADRLEARFQPILDLRTGALHGFEGLVRGPSNSVFQAPLNLFAVAHRTGQLGRLERACLRTLIRRFEAPLPNVRLFLNVSPDTLTGLPGDAARVAELFRPSGLQPSQVVIELTESTPTTDFELLVHAAEHYRRQGFGIAMDDLGAGFSSLRLLSELRPDYVKVDMHFVQGVSQDPQKVQFLRSIHELARGTGARVVAEGLETEADLATVQELGLDFGQGYLLGRPHGEALTPSVGMARVREAHSALLGRGTWAQGGRSFVGGLLRDVVPLPADATHDQVHARFQADPALRALPVVEGDRPLGLIGRDGFTDFRSRDFSRELYGKRPCRALVRTDALQVDHRTTLQELSHLLTEADPSHLQLGFVITRGGRYLGVGSGHDLMRELTRLQLQAARYANPLTLLPGNVPILERLELLMQQGEGFVVVYADLDHFKAFNDTYGYQPGDEVIRWTGALLDAACERELDFLGHIGGDDFLMIFRSRAWQARCLQLLEDFERGVPRFFRPEHREAGGYTSLDRQGREVHHPLISLSLGAVRVEPGTYSSPQELSEAAAVAKHQAKGVPGCHLFVERRSR